MAVVTAAVLLHMQSDSDGRILGTDTVGVDMHGKAGPT
jgi:hypothetical protein